MLIPALAVCLKALARKILALVLIWLIIITDYSIIVFFSGVSRGPCKIIDIIQATLNMSMMMMMTTSLRRPPRRKKIENWH